MQLEGLQSKIRESLEAKNKARESALPLSRQVIRNSSVAIRAIHGMQFDRAGDFLAKAEKGLREAQEFLRLYPEIYNAGFLQDAEKEYSEARATFSLVANQPLPDPDELKVGYAPFLLGLGEAMGELRRHILDIIRRDELAEGERFLVAMDDIYYFLFSFDFPDALTPGLRRITDMARSIIERTRGDLTTAISQSALRDELESLEKRLK